MIFLQIVPGKKIAVTDFLLHFTDYIGPNGYIMLAIFIIGYCYKALFDFLLNGAYRTVSLSTLMFEPYARIFIQQFTVIVGSFFLMFNGGGKIFILVFALARILFEVWFDYERRIKLLLRKNQERSSSHS